METSYSTDSDLDSVFFVAEDGSAFSKEELEGLVLTGVNPHTQAPLSDREITVIHRLLLDDSPDDIIENVDYEPFFKYPYLTMYSLMAIQLGYIIWSII